MTHTGDHATQATTVVLVEDHDMVADMLARELVTAGFTVAATAATVAAGYTAWQHHRPDVLLCDMGLGDSGTGLDLLRKIMTDDPDAVVVMVSAENDGPLVEEAFTAGARGYVAKRASLSELVETITDALAGVNRAADRHTYRNVIATLRRARPAPGVHLTERERQVLNLLAQGNVTTAGLAATLQISPSTVKSHVDNCVRKLGVHSRAEAVGAAYRLGLIHPG